MREAIITVTHELLAKLLHLPDDVEVSAHAFGGWDRIALKVVGDGLPEGCDHIEGADLNHVTLGYATTNHECGHKTVECTGVTYGRILDTMSARLLFPPESPNAGG